MSKPLAGFEPEANGRRPTPYTTRPLPAHKKAQFLLCHLAGELTRNLFFLHVGFFLFVCAVM